MKILYGVVGEGMGHAMRSRVVLDHLIGEGHEVEVIASQRAVDFLAKHFPAVHRVHGLHIVYEKNRVRRGQTFWQNIRNGTMALPKQIKSYFDLIERFRPNAVVSDFESWTYLYGKFHRIPVFSVDNIQMINRCFHDSDIIDVDRKNFEFARAFVKSKLPNCEHYLITTFYYPPVRKERTSLHPPILRPRILEAIRSSGSHLLVYQTAEGNESLAEVLSRCGVECRVYGMRRSITEEQVEGNLRYRPFSEDAFVEDLASCQAVVSGGGFTLMSEAVYLHKPVLSTPVVGQFEQLLNALYLEREGYGMYAPVVDDATLTEFLRRIPSCAARLATYTQEGNRSVLSALDALLDQAAAGL